MNWVNAVKEHTTGEVVAIDGKTARGSRDRKNNRGPLHMVSAWACSNRLVLAQQSTDEKSNEITAIPKLLSILELKGCLVTIDAMGCQKPIASQIVDQEADYVIGLKGNQGILHKQVANFFDEAKGEHFRTIDHDYTLRNIIPANHPATIAMMMAMRPYPTEYWWAKLKTAASNPVLRTRRELAVAFRTLPLRTSNTSIR